ncbi:hypothetical protein QWY31_14705 [Cytophagales bacterium LB-30]|uniref:Uncharacterized protein n=1 Tax=Shiella aurantiaca TaxID=3058365 RepID=A0ABT8F8Q6_9BACT|nr:hypothetical protein [Shiella aurantiaca]MDN4166759.1 hypothetical protein [Shiella aurantiaca]
MKKKLTVLGLLYGLGFVIGGCIDCNCTEFAPIYQDYSELSVAYENIVPLNDSLKMRVQRAALLTLSQASDAESRGTFIQGAMACDCPGPQYLDKYSVSRMDIYADSVFVEGRAANEAITDLFEIRTNNFQPYVSLDDRNYFSLNTEWEEFQIKTGARPVNTERTYTLRIELTKSNNTTISYTTGDIVWVDF